MRLDKKFQVLKLLDDVVWVVSKSPIARHDVVGTSDNKNPIERCKVNLHKSSKNLLNNAAWNTNDLDVVVRKMGLEIGV